MNEENQIVVYQPNETMRLEVKVDHERDTVWLTQDQMCKLFGRDRSVINRHVRNAISSGEVNENNNVQILHKNHKGRPQAMYDLEIIIAVGYRVNSMMGSLFRRWATRILLSHLRNTVHAQGKAGISEAQIIRKEMDRRFQEQGAQILELRKDVDFFIQASIPPKEKVFVDGQMLDAQVELTRIVRTAKKRIVLIDNYIDERTLMLLGERGENVSCLVYTMKPNSPRLSPALENYAKEFPTKPIELKGYKKSHDRFLIVDDTIWHVGASLKDAGAALFALMKMELKPEVILSLL